MSYLKLLKSAQYKKFISKLFEYKITDFFFILFEFLKNFEKAKAEYIPETI